MRSISMAFTLMLIQGCGFYASAAADATPVEPVTRFKLPVQVKETSGLASTDNTLWTLNDSGDKPFIYGLNKQTGKVVKRLRLEGANNLDWEDMAQDDTHLYIADTGNNAGKRKRLSIYKISRQELNADSSVQAQRLTLRYADYAAQTTGGKRSHNVDCEAVARVGDKLWLFSKNRGDQKTRLYQADINTLNMQTLSPVGEYPVKGLVTAADYNVETSELALLVYGYGPSFGRASIWRLPVTDNLPDWGQAKRYRLKRPGQWESILWQGKDRVTVTAEGSFFGGPELADIEL